MDCLERMELLSSWIWNGFFLPGIVVLGVLFLFQTGFLPIVRVREIWKHTLGEIFGGKGDQNEISPFEVLCMALAGTVGTGSVVGTCQALSVGGPGALFWLWVASFLGMIVKFYEVTLAVVFRRRDENGEWVGGPMYYLSRGLKKGGRGLAICFSVFALFSGFGMGNLAQGGSISSEVKRIARLFCSLSTKEETVLSCLLAGGLFAVLCYLLLGGVKRIGKLTSFLTPLMSAIFVFLSGTVIVAHRAALPEVFRSVFRGAFSSRAVLGGVSGIGMKKALEWGLKRSAFSNEAGLGSAAIAHASARTDHPVKQGFFGIVEVFADTMVICTLTALAVLVGVPAKAIFAHPDPDAELIIRSFSSVFGNGFATMFVGGCLILFAFSTLIGWSFYGEGCARYLFGKKGRTLYRVLFCLVAAMGVLLPLRPIWVFSDLLNGLMSIPNLIGLLFLSETVQNQVNEYFQKKKENPK